MITMKPNKKFEVFNENIEFLLRELGEFLNRKMPKGWGFTLQIFSFGKNGSNFYISNANRDDMVKMMKEFIEREEKS